MVNAPASHEERSVCPLRIAATVPFRLPRFFLSSLFVQMLRGQERVPGSGCPRTRQNNRNDGPCTAGLLADQAKRDASGFFLIGGSLSITGTSWGRLCATSAISSAGLLAAGKEPARLFVGVRK